MLAERTGFEPAEALTSHAFQACALDLSAIFPSPRKNISQDFVFVNKFLDYYGILILLLIGRKIMDECIFCKIIKGDIPCYKIYEDENVFAFLDIAKDIYGHTLVIPKKHCKNILDANDEVLKNVMIAVKKISNHYINECGFDGVNIINASNECAEQSVFHFHMHIIPRKNGDKLKVFPHFLGTDAELEDVQEKLKLN